MKQKIRMDERCRIYELARRMNVPNQCIIDCLRELGYDVKNHSSIIDAAAIKSVIAFHKNKTNQERSGLQKNKKESGGKNNRLGGSEDSGPPAQGSLVPKKPYPGSDPTAVILPLPKGKSVDDDMWS